MAPIITLTTDFGLADGYVASMKGVILSILPTAVIVDVSHQVPPQDVLHGAFVLSATHGFFPEGTVHVAVVDPGVGAQRKPIAVSWRGSLFVAPDNGVLSLALALPPPAARRDPRGPLTGPLPQGARAHELLEARYRLPRVSATFHGRDVFAPAAAHLASGVPLEQMGPALSAVRYLDAPAPSAGPGGAVRGRVIHIDAFGNAVTNLRREDLPGEEVEVRVAGATVQGLARTYADRDGTLALMGSSGYLEIAVNGGSAARVLGLQRGHVVEVRPRR